MAGDSLREQAQVSRRAEHQAIVAAESDLERRRSMNGVARRAAQIDLAALRAEDIDWEGRVIGFVAPEVGIARRAAIWGRGGGNSETVAGGWPLFPKWAKLTSSKRANYFRRRCKSAGIAGVSLAFVYVMAGGTAKVAGYPERFAQEALGHKSKAVLTPTRVEAVAVLPGAGGYEKRHVEGKVTPPTCAEQSVGC
jgi:hypothetical protein